jgi:hypothetical protein
MTDTPVINFDVLVDKYIRLRDKKAELRKAHQAEIDKFDQAMTAIERIFLAEMKKQGSTSVATNHGTAYQRRQDSVTIADREIFRNFVLDNPEHWIFADLRANAPAVKAYLDERDELPPGVNLTSRLTVNVQR